MPKRLALYVAVVAPALYFVAVTQYSAIVFPFWDHLELASLVAALFDGTLRLGDLAVPHNGTRPVTYRAIYLANAALTRWDIRSEYVYMIAVGLSTWAIHLAIAFRLVGRERHLAAWVTAAFASILVFSPVGHNTHWWSMMLQLTLANALIVAAVACIAFASDSWPRHTAAAVLAWLAAFTHPNGIFVMAFAALVMQLSGRNLRKPDPFALFWAINLVLVIVAYGDTPLPPQGPAGPGDRLLFLLAYVGTPLASLLLFPFQGPFDTPAATGWTATVGALVVAMAVDALRSAWDALRRSEPRAIVLWLFTGIGLASAFGALHHLGVGQGNASRSSIFAADVLFGAIYWHASGDAPRSFARALARRAHLDRWGAIAVAIVLAVSLGTYREALRVYDAARSFNQELAGAFNASGAASSADKLAYPNAEVLSRARGDLLRLGLGPYRFRATTTVRLGSNKLAETVTLAPGSSFSQRFRLARPGLSSLQFQVVTWGKKPSSYPIEWALIAAARGETIARGKVDAGTLQDWTAIPLALDGHAANETQFELVVKASPGPPVDAPVGLPLFHPEEGASEPAAIVAEGTSRPPLGLTATLAGS